jgi:hypothetical protein
MARLLCVWEQGGQLGHLNRLKRPIELALQMGHEVFLAARELRNVKAVMGDLPITLLQSPFKQNLDNAGADQYLSYTHMLTRQCFSDADELDALTRAWRSLFDLVQPQAVLFDHSPTALVGALSHRFKKIVIGYGFEIPPAFAGPDVPFGRFPTTPDTQQVHSALLKDDSALLGCINQVLMRQSAAPLGRLTDIYAQVDHTLCLTWPALDPFGPRADLQYLGSQSLEGGQVPQWPPGVGPKVFGYLQAFPSLPQLLQDLQSAGVRALLCVRDAPDQWVQSQPIGPVRLTNALVDMRCVASEADWAISHGNHTTAATLARAGLPQLLIPRHQEQLFLSLRLVRRGSAAMVFQDQTGFSAAIAAMRDQPLLATQARLLQTELAPIDPQHGIFMIMDVLYKALN